MLRYPNRPPPEISDLYMNVYFLGDIKAYNSMFSLMSFGANIYDNLNNGRGPYVFKIFSQICHWIGSLCPKDTNGPRFLQLYIFDTENEVSNRLKAFDCLKKMEPDDVIVQLLMEFLTTHNEYVQTFKTDKEIVDAMNLDSYVVRLYSDVSDRRYGVSAHGSLGCIVTGDDTGYAKYSIIVHSKSGRPQ